MTLTKSLKVLGRISKSIQQELSNRDGFKTRVEKLKPFAQVKHAYTRTEIRRLGTCTQGFLAQLLLVLGARRVLGILRPDNPRSSPLGGLVMSEALPRSEGHSVLPPSSEDTISDESLFHGMAARLLL